MSIWTRNKITTHELALALKMDAGTLKAWYIEKYGRAPSQRIGWSRAEVASVRGVIARNRKLLSTNKVAAMFHVDHATIERNWARDGFVLPKKKHHIGWSSNGLGRGWSQADIVRLVDWLRVRYGAVNGALGKPVKAWGRRPPRAFFNLLSLPPEVLQMKAGDVCRAIAATASAEHVN